MIDNIMLTPLEDNILNNIMYELNNDPEVNKFVRFSNTKQLCGILLNNEVIGLFELCKFIENNVAIHIALLKEHRNKGIGKFVMDKIVETYGKEYSDSKYFIANIDYRNERAINAMENANWEKNDDYNEIMINEGSKFFTIYQKRNPLFDVKRKELLYDKK